MLDEPTWHQLAETFPEFARQTTKDTVTQIYGETARVIVKRPEVADLVREAGRWPSGICA